MILLFVCCPKTTIADFSDRNWYYHHHCDSNSFVLSQQNHSSNCDFCRSGGKNGQGELETRIPVRGNDELATLGSNINGMAAQLQDLLKTLENKASQLNQHNSVLSALALNPAVIQGNAKLAAQTFTEAIAQTLNLERVGIWLYNNDYSNLTCLDQYDLSVQQHTAGTLLKIDPWSEPFQISRPKPLLSSTTSNQSQLHNH